LAKKKDNKKTVGVTHTLKGDAADTQRNANSGAAKTPYSN